MPHIKLDNALPGIRGLFAFRPDAGAALKALADTLLRGPSPLSMADREMIAAAVSAGNSCRFCRDSHAAVARAHLGSEHALMDQVLAGVDAAAVSAKLKALLHLAEHVRKGGTAPDASVAAARAAGADDLEIHDTTLIAAAFCMFNRYVDGLGTRCEVDASAFAAMGRHLATHGYR